MGLRVSGIQPLRLVLGVSRAAERAADDKIGVYRASGRAADAKIDVCRAAGRVADAKIGGCRTVGEPGGGLHPIFAAFSQFSGFV